jgi:hypothetical protein
MDLATFRYKVLGVFPQGPIHHTGIKRHRKIPISNLAFVSLHVYTSWYGSGDLLMWFFIAILGPPLFQQQNPSISRSEERRQSSAWLMSRGGFNWAEDPPTHWVIIADWETIPYSPGLGQNAHWFKKGRKSARKEIRLAWPSNKGCFTKLCN